jgi:hypothetical protein
MPSSCSFPATATPFALTLPFRGPSLSLARRGLGRGAVTLVVGLAGGEGGDDLGRRHRQLGQRRSIALAIAPIGGTMLTLPAPSAP